MGDFDVLSGNFSGSPEVNHEDTKSNSQLLALVSFCF